MRAAEEQKLIEQCVADLAKLEAGEREAGMAKPKLPVRAGEAVPVAENDADWQAQRGDALLVVALAAGSSVRDAATQAGVSERTAWRRLSDEQFRRAVAEARAQVIENGIGRLADLTTKAVDTLAAVMDCDDPKARLAAAQAVLKVSLPLETRFNDEAKSLRPTRTEPWDPAELGAMYTRSVPVGPAKILPELLGEQADGGE